MFTTDEILAPHSVSQINRALRSQPASTATQLALVELLKEFDVLPEAVVGHSSGIGFPERRLDIC